MSKTKPLEPELQDDKPVSEASQPDAGQSIEQFPLRLEWRDPAELDDNPANWRLHPDSQLRALEDVISEVGFADALLYNERTKRLLDGHARKKVARPGEKVPVLIGSWTEAQEKVILATLDTSTAMAKADPDALDALLADISLSSHDMLNFLEQVAKEAQAEREDADEGEDAKGDDVDIEQMELLPFEHYDYVLVIARNVNDWNFLSELCGLKKVNSCPIQGKKKIGLGRAIEASALIRRLKDAIQDRGPQPETRPPDDEALKVDPRGHDLRG